MAGNDAMDSDIVITDPEDGGTLWDKFAWGVWVGMVRNQREYGAKWGGSKQAASGHSVADCTSRRWGGTWGKLWKYAIVSPGKGKGGVLSGFLLRQPRDGASASSMRGTIAAVRIAEDMGWTPPWPRFTGAWPKARGGGRLSILPFSLDTQGSGQKGVGYAGGAAHGGTHVPFVVRLPARLLPSGWRM